MVLSSKSKTKTGDARTVTTAAAHTKTTATTTTSSSSVATQIATTPSTNTRKATSSSSGRAMTPAAETMYEHWQAIADGDYNRAYGYFAGSYSTSRADWVRSKIGAPPDIDLKSIYVQDTGRRIGAAHLVMVKLITHDPGDSDCNRLHGLVVVVHNGGRWLYSPKRPEDGPGYFRVDQHAVSGSDPRCVRIL